MFEGTLIPQACFIKRELTIHHDIDYSKLLNESIDWKTIQLSISDIIRGGPTRSVIVDMFHDTQNHHIFLKTVQRLEKREFEEIFGFRVGEFVPDRIVRVDADCLRIK